ncbi:MAG: gliding motility protein GldN [Dysgonamonadaceae bacterium]|jgi:gliding motility associated protien GldN|nr:gliding motility protein GldN [Dysgonamonadaceae bacterium]
MKKFFTNNLSLLILTLSISGSVVGQSSIRNQRGEQNRRTGTQTQQRKVAADAIQPQRPVTEDEEQTKPSVGTPSGQQQQTTTTDRRTRLQQQQQQPNKHSDLTERARIRNEENSKAPQHVVWLREIYRVINLDSANNAALKFPVQPVGDRVNLFTLIFRLMQENKIETYNYEADREVDFSESGQAKFEDVLTKNQIPFTVEGEGANRVFKVEDIDIPSGDVTEYLIKEGWLFDEATGTFNSQVIAICPTIVSIDYNDNTTHKTNFCWVTYESIRPYLQRTMVMTSDYNNAMTYTLDDFFVKKMYHGDILKTVNMKNLTLAQQVGAEPDVLRRAQDSIEAQLKGFEQRLWVQPDTTATVKGGKKAAKTTGRKVKTTTKAAKSDEKQGQTGTVRSVRRNK